MKSTHFAVYFATYIHSCANHVAATQGDEIYTRQFNGPEDGIQDPRRTEITFVPTNGIEEPLEYTEDRLLPRFQDIPELFVDLISNPDQPETSPITLTSLPKVLSNDVEYLQRSLRFASETTSFVYYLFSSYVDNMLRPSSAQRTAYGTRTWMEDNMKPVIDLFKRIGELAQQFGYATPSVVIRTVKFLYKFVRKTIHYLVSAKTIGAVIIDAVLFVYAFLVVFLL